MNLLRITFITILFSACFSTAFGQEVMTLEKAISLGLENNFQIKIAEKNIEIAENNNSWARAGRTPTIDLNANFTNNLIKDNNPASFLNGTFFTGGLGPSLDAQWIVYNGGRIRIAKEQLEQLYLQQKLLSNSDIHNTLKDIIQQYNLVLFQQERLQVLKDIMSLSKDRLRYEETKKEFGSSNSYNLIQFENAIITDSSNLVSQLNQIEIAKRNLYNVLDLVGYQKFDFPETLSVEVEDIDEEKLQDILSEENYSLKSLQILSELDQLNTKIENGSRKPTISVSGSLGFSENLFKFFGKDAVTSASYDAILSNRINTNLSANLNWRLFDGNLRKQNIENAKIQEEISQMNFLEAQAQINNQLGILIANYDYQKELLKMADEQIILSQRNLEMTNERFKAGQINSLDYRNVQNQFLNAAFNKVNAIYNLIVTKSEIDWLVGRFSEL